jgi:hypothetical protein
MLQSAVQTRHAEFSAAFGRLRTAVHVRLIINSRSRSGYCNLPFILVMLNFRQRSADYKQPFAFVLLQTAVRVRDIAICRSVSLITNSRMRSGYCNLRSIFFTLNFRQRSADYEQPFTFASLQTAVRVRDIAICRSNSSR